MVLPTFPRLIEVRAKKEFDETKLNLSIYNNSKMKRVSLTENELNGVPAWQTWNLLLDSNCIKRDGEYYSKEEWTEVEYVAYRRVKRIFIPIMNIESENPKDIEELRVKISSWSQNEIIDSRI